MLRGGDGMRIAILLLAALTLGAIVLGGDMFFAPMTAPKKPETAKIVHQVPIPDINGKLLEQTKDATADQRFVLEPEIYEHLLVRSTDIAPGSLRALGMKESSYTVAQLRKQPERYRGKPIWFEGEIERLEQDTKRIPGLPNTRTRGLLRTDSGDPVFFTVVGDVSKQLTKGSYARVEGIFFKLRDERFPERIDKAPFIVGMDLRASFRKWEPVKTLDPSILSKIHDTTPEEAAETEEIPLYHLISYAMNQPREGEWKQAYPDLDAKASRAIMEQDGSVKRGAPFRLNAALFQTHTVAAEANPLGVDFWTKAWIEHPDIGTVQIQMPGRLEGEWNMDDYVVVYGHFFKRTYYETLPKNGSRHFKMAPFFVADTMLHWRLKENANDATVKLIMTVVTIILILAMVMLVIRDSRSNHHVRDALIERRRQRRLAKNKNEEQGRRTQ
ncbi:MAG: hypothetical protein CSA62_12410 [Planctomycetota bacterium]|nr:MAG: hypothetical protein CSA62_12410 [Planctomycetota bacterium]